MTNYFTNLTYIPKVYILYTVHIHVYCLKVKKSAVEVFKAILGYMGDRKHGKSEPIAIAHEIIVKGWQNQGT